jgi:hypothetical protein
MFRTAPVAEPGPGSEVTVSEISDLIPLSHLALDLDPGEPWPLFLGRRGIAFKPDRIGRDAVAVGDAARLIAEKREHELRTQAVLRMQEAAAIAADELRRAQLWPGVSAELLPVGVSAGDAMAQAARESLPKRRSLVEDSLAGEGTTYHPWPSESDVA